MFQQESGKVMWHEFWEAWKGRAIWQSLKNEYNIDYDKIVLVMPEKDEAWNSCALKYLPDFMKRKNAKGAIVCISDAGQGNFSDIFAENIKVHKMSPTEIARLFRYYCMYKFFDNIVFLYLDKPIRDNKSRYAMEKCNISMDELICLCFYKMRQVPSHV